MNNRETTRRRLLRLLAAASLSALRPAQALGGLSPVAGNPTRVIVIGAGMAGLAAANALRNAGVDTVVLEARDRIGGRLWTRDLGGTPVDFGGSWIHDPVGNPMTAFAQSAGVGQTPVIPPRNLASIHLFQEESGAGNLFQVLEAFSHYGLFEQRTPQLLAQLGPQASIKDAIERYVAQVALTLTPEQQRLVTHLLRFIEETFDSGPWETISLDQHVHSSIDNYGGSEFGDFPDGGYIRLVRAMASDSEIRLGHRVTGVRAEAFGVTVNTQRSDGTPLSFRGSHALVTLPLGVLKQVGVAFDPPLDAARNAAIGRLGFGNFEKIALRFDEVFWERGPLPKSHFYFRSASQTQPTEFPFFLDLQKTLNQPVLVGLTSASFAQDFAAMGEAAVRARVMAILREAYRVPVPEPTHVLTSSWGRDPLTRGAYSYLPIGATSADMDALAEPHAGRVLFAGEATNAQRYGYADGAMSSGLREVERLIGTGKAVLRPGSPD